MRRAGRVVAVLVAAAALPGAGAAAMPPRADDAIPLLAPVREVDPLKGAGQLGLRPDRLLTSVVPGPVDNREAITVAVGPSGAPAVVTDDQQLVITKAGSYIIRELGPARQAAPVGDTVPPVLELGQVVWQGFSPGRRTLTARLTLDAALESHRLPMAVSLTFTDRSGRPRPLQTGAGAPADGTIHVRIANQTGSPRTVATGTAAVRPLAAALDRLYAAARVSRPAVPPYAGNGLPMSVPGRATGTQVLTVAAPLRVNGTIGVRQGTRDTVSGPGTTPAAAGATVAGTLDGDATFDVGVTTGQHLALDLDVRPWLDPRALVPPAASWRAWAAGGPSASDVGAATATLVQAAAAAARAAEYSPYLQADTPGPDLSSFHYVVAPPAAAPRAARALRPKPVGIAAAALAALAVAGNAALLWRRL